MNKRVCALAVLLLCAFGGRAAAADGALPQGTRVLGGGSGHLDVGKPGPGQTFEISVVGSNGHTCSLEGKVSGGIGKVEGDDGEVCIVRFAAEGDAIRVSTDTAEPCRNWCGARAWFEGTYLAVPKGCQPAEVKAARSRFKKAYDKKTWAQAKEELQPVLDRCAPLLDRFTLPWIRNDLALTLLKLGDRAGCLSVLEPLREWASQPDEDFGVEPVFEQESLRMAKATRHNLKLCGAEKP